MEGIVRDLTETSKRFRSAYEARDVERMMELFADDAELTWAVGTFRGKDAIRKVFEWDVRLSPTAAVHDAGIGVVATDHAVVSERVVDLTADGVPYHERAVSVMEVDEAGRIRSLRSYYDKLEILHQVASRYPGVRGIILRLVTGSLVRLGSRGLEVTPS